MIGGIAAIVVALAGVAAAVVLTKGTSSTPTRLAAAPVVTVTASTPAVATSSAIQTTATTPATATSSTSTTSHTATSGTTAGRPAIPSQHATTSQTSEQQAVRSTIQREFALISEHKFSAAYALLSPNLQTGEQGWVESHRENGIYSVNVATAATVHSPGSATASIVNMRTLDGEGCKNWTGSWNLIKIDGKWRINEANIAAGQC